MYPAATCAVVIETVGYALSRTSKLHRRTAGQSLTRPANTAGRRGVPVLTRGDSQLLGDGRGLKRAVKRVAYPLFIRRFAACLSVGQRSAEYFRYYGARRIVHSPHFVDNAFFASRAALAAARRDELRAAWGADASSVLVLLSVLCVKARVKSI